MALKNGEVDPIQLASLDELSLDEGFELLMDPRIRETIPLLARTQAEISPEQLAEKLRVTNSRSQAERTCWNTTSSTAIEITLVHAILPKLDEYELIRYDHVNKSIRTDESIGDDLSVLEDATV